MCNPTGVKLFHPNNVIDLQIGNPCTQLKEEKVDAHEIIHNGIKFYYNKDSDNLINIYEYNLSLDAYTGLKSDHPYYSILIEKIDGL